MIINGKEVEVDFRKAAEIQDRVNKVNNLPDSTKVEVNKKDLKELKDYAMSEFDSFDGYGMSNNTLLTGKNSKENRKDYYSTFQEMSECNFIHRGLQIIADDCSQKNIEGHTVKVYSDDDEIKETLEELFYERLNIDKELWSIIYETCKLGDNFYEVIPDSYQNPTMIARIRYLEAERVNRIERNGKLAFYTYTADAVDPEEMMFRQPPMGEKKDEEKVMYKLEPWQMIHFRITDKDFYPYGGSLLKSGVKCFRRLQLLEDGMVIYRLARVPERRVFKIGCGSLPQSEANRQVQRIKDNYRTQQILDDRGNINRTASALSLTQDIFIPVREGDSGTEITTLGAGTALNNIDDIRYFRDQILWTMNIPPEYLGFTSDQGGGSQGRGSLAMQDIKFSRFAERIQYHIEEALTKIAAIELFFKHKKKDELKNFRLELTPPSNIKEIMDLEFILNKMNLIQSMNGTGLFPKKFILQYVMKMTKKEIDNLVFFKDLEAQAAQTQENAMIGGMGAPGMDMGGMGAGGMPPPGGDMGAGAMSPAGGTAPAASPAPASINTESREEKLVRIFGKDILIEHKEDFAKLIKAANDYDESLKSKEEIVEDDNIDDSLLMKQLSETISGKKSEKHTNENTISLIYENELGGLNYDKQDFSTFEAPKKRTGPKTGSAQYLYEEKTVHFDY